MSDYQLKLHIEKPGTPYTDPKTGAQHPSSQGVGSQSPTAFPVGRHSQSPTLLACRSPCRAAHWFACSCRGLRPPTYGMPLAACPVRRLAKSDDFPCRSALAESDVVGVPVALTRSTLARMQLSGSSTADLRDVGCCLSRTSVRRVRRLSL